MLGTPSVACSRDGPGSTPTPTSGSGKAASSEESRKVATSASSEACATVPPGSPSTRQARLPLWSSSSCAASRAASRMPARSAAPTSAPVAARRTCSRRRVRRNRESRLPMRSSARPNRVMAPPTTITMGAPPVGCVRVSIGGARQARASSPTKRRVVAKGTGPLVGAGRPMPGWRTASTSSPNAGSQPRLMSGVSQSTAATSAPMPASSPASSSRAAPSGDPATAKPRRAATNRTSR